MSYRQHIEEQRRHEALSQSLSGTTRAETLKDIEALGDEHLPAELRGDSGSGKGTDGLRLSELQKLINRGAEATGDV